MLKSSVSCRSRLAVTDPNIMERYLERLECNGRPAASLASLHDLVTRHQEIVPFENLDVIEGRHPDLSTEGVLHKIVIRRRGGFCYELNEAFRALLEHLGFAVRRIEARVWSPRAQAFGAPFDHLALVVTLPEGEFLTDVGFGDNNRAPLCLPNDHREDVSGEYTLAAVDATRLRLSRPDGALYDMTLVSQPLSAYVPMYRHHQSSPDSIFTKGLICTRATPLGRVTLSGDRLILMENGVRTESLVPDRSAALEHHFGLLQEIAS
jgi:N-hydroxyarylamine O-acetyltransferase